MLTGETVYPCSSSPRPPQPTYISWSEIGPRAYEPDRRSLPHRSKRDLRIGHAYAATGPSQVLELAALETEQPCSIADLQHSVIATRGRIR